MEIEKTIFKIFDYIMPNNSITTKDMIELGISKYYIKQIKQLGYASNSKRGQYVFDTPKALFLKGKYFQEKGKKAIANGYFKQYYEIDPENPKINFEMFKIAILEKKFEEAIGYYDKMKNIDDVNARKVIYLYMYFLSFIVRMPKKLRELSYSMTLRNLDKDSNVIFRNLRINQFFDISMLMFMFYSDDNLSFGQDKEIFEVLLEKIARLNDLRKSKLKSFIEATDYKAIEDFLEEEREYRYLSSEETMVLYAVYKILGVAEEKIDVSNVRLTKQESFILSGDFEKALEIENKKSKDCQYSLLAMLLSAYLKEKFSKKTSEAPEKYGEGIRPAMYTSTNNLTNMYVGLVNNEVERALEFLSEYLKEKEKNEYFTFIKGHIMLALKEGDNTFIKVMQMIMKILNGECKIDIKEYVDMLTSYFYRKLYDEALICLEMINSVLRLDDVIGRDRDEETLGKLNRISTELRDELKKKDRKKFSVLPKED